MAQASLYTLPQDTIHDVDARGPRGPRATMKIRPSKKQIHDVDHYVRIAFWGLGQPGAQGQPGGPKETMKIRPSKKQQSHDVSHHVRIAFLGLWQPEPVRSSHE